MNIDGRLLNRPIKLHWAGWETDTYQLAQHGWQISADQNLRMNQMMIAINHPKGGIRGMTGIEEWHFQRIMQEGAHATLPTSLKFDHIAKDIWVRTTTPGDFDFHAIDPVPRYEQNMIIQKLEDLAHFATVGEQSKNQLYLEEASIDQILEMAITKQTPDQERIRAEMLHRQEMQEYKRGTLHTELRLVA